MLALLRRSRLLALALILAAPGVAGTAVQWLHSCPAQASAASEHHGQSQAPAHGHGQTCHCIGSCHMAGVLPAPGSTARITISFAESNRRIVDLFGISFEPAGAPTHLLPPATAPPA
jgi:hypothetical protein